LLALRMFKPVKSHDASYESVLGMPVPLPR
jgi:hypothetical protein